MSAPEQEVAKVVPFPCHRADPIDPDKVLQSYVGEYRDVLLVGYARGDDRLVLASSLTDTADLVLLLERAKAQLMADDD